MKHIIKIIACLLFCGSHVYGQGITPKAEIKPYIEFIEQPHPSAKEYILSLFDKHDIVILSEGHHGEIYQYDLIHDIISDKRFIDKVGNVFTEIGVANMNNEVNDFLHGSYLPSEADSILSDLYIKLYRRVIWDKYNFYLYLKRIYQLNQSLPVESKINTYCTGKSFSWDDRFTLEQYCELFKKGNYHDSILAANMISNFEKIQNQPRKKALVIFNRPHSIKTAFVCPDEEDDDNDGIWNPINIDAKFAAYYIKEKYGDRVTTVLLNTVVFFGNDDNMAIADGKWDAAFYYKGYPDMGFSFKGSPFGKDTADFYNVCWQYKKERYEDMFDSFVYYKSPKDMLVVNGIPEVVNPKTAQELYRRMNFVDSERFPTKSPEESIETATAYGGTFSLTHMLSEQLEPKRYEKYMKAIDQWFEKR